MKPTRVIAVGVLLAAALTGCGSNAESAGKTTGTASTAREPVAPDAWCAKVSTVATLKQQEIQKRREGAQILLGDRAKGIQALGAAGKLADQRLKLYFQLLNDAPAAVADEALTISRNFDLTRAPPSATNLANAQSTVETYIKRTCHVTLSTHDENRTVLFVSLQSLPVNRAVMGQPVVFTATAQGPKTLPLSGRMQFFDNERVLGTLATTTGVATLTTSTLSVGKHVVYVIFNTAQAVARSPEVTLEVVPSR